MTVAATRTNEPDRPIADADGLSALAAASPGRLPTPRPAAGRATKLLVLAWAVLAVAAEIWLMRGWHLTTLAVGAAAAALALALLDRRSIAAVLVCTYAFPVLIGAYYGRYQAQFGIIWMGALLGAILPGSLRGDWNIPAPWRGALVCWALTIVAGTAIVVAREVDFIPAMLLRSSGAMNSASGIFPSAVIAWAVHVSLVLILGILWFDWLCGAGAPLFNRYVVGPLLAGCLLLTAVSAYQMMVDIDFLNQSVYGSLGRATGTMRDANLAGTIAAMWLGGVIVWSGRLGRRRPYVLAAGAIATWLAVWASGSRTAFGAAIVVTLFGLAAFWRSRGGGAATFKVGRAAAAVAIVAAAFLLFVVVSRPASGPLRRWAELPTSSVADLAGELWRRNGYGAAATDMIRDSPWFGSGIGSFPVMLADWAPELPPDNAQNWYRHQLVEFGLIGSLGWIAWLFGFGRWVFKRGPIPEGAWIVRGVLAGVGIISLLGMPTQDISVALTFWTFAFWYVELAGPPDSSPRRPGRLAWGAIAVVVLVFAAGTFWLAVGRFRPPIRAQRGGWPYMWGLSYPEPDSGGQYRWARQRAVAVVDAPRRWLALSVRVNHSDIATRPVDVKVWRDGRLSIAARLSSTAPVVRYIHLPDSERRVVVETWASRAVHPEELGVGDARELGLMVRWDFLDGPPAVADRSLLQ